MKVVRIPGKREPLLPVPIWKWHRKSGVWVQSGSKKLKGTWVRPVLPAWLDGPRKVRDPSGKRQGWLIKPLDYRRAEIVLALYVRSEGIEDYEEFMEPRGGFSFMSYPGPPVHYRGGEVWPLFCCLEKKIHRYIAESKELRNPIKYYFCLTHWRHLLKMSWRKKQIFQCPDFTESEKGNTDQYGSAGTRGDYLELEREWEGKCGVRGSVTTNNKAFLLRCGIPGTPWGHRGKHRNGKDGKGEPFETPKPTVCLGSYETSDGERHKCLKEYMHQRACGPKRPTPTVRAISAVRLQRKKEKNR